MTPVWRSFGGLATLETLEAAEAFDVLFTDVVLPGGMSGRDLAQLTVERCPDMLVVYTSGYAKSTFIHGGRLDPGVELLEKRFHLVQLAQRVRAVPDRPRGRTG
jgi:CheY-like chemotaxis protein